MHIFGTTPLGNQNWLKISRPRKHLISTSAITEFHYTNNNQIKILITSWFFLLLTYEQIAIFPGNESKVKYERKTSNVNTLCPHGCQSKINNRTTSHLGREMYAYTGFVYLKVIKLKCGLSVYSWVKTSGVVTIFTMTKCFTGFIILRYYSSK